MAIDVATETILTLTEAAKTLPRRRAGKKVHPSCLYRWTTNGCRGVLLEFVQIGGTRCTSQEALARFFEALTAAAQGDAPVPPPPSMSRRRAIEAAERRLARASL